MGRTTSFRGFPLATATTIPTSGIARLDTEFPAPSPTRSIRLEKIRTDAFTEFRVSVPLNSLNHDETYHYSNRFGSFPAGVRPYASPIGCYLSTRNSDGSIDEGDSAKYGGNIAAILGTNVLGALGNEGSPVKISQTSETSAESDFVGFGHGYTRQTSSVFRVNGAVIDYAAAAADTVWFGSEIEIANSQDLLFPEPLNASSTEIKWATYNTLEKFNRFGRTITTQIVTTVEALIYTWYLCALQVPSQDYSESPANGVPANGWGGSIGGGISNLYVIGRGLTQIPANATPVRYSVLDSSSGIIGWNNFYGRYVDLISSEFTFPVSREITMVNRNDQQNKLYYSITADETNGMTVPVGSIFNRVARHRSMLGDISPFI